MMMMLHVIFCLSPGIWQWLIGTTLGSTQIYCVIGVEKSCRPAPPYVCSGSDPLGKQRILWITAAHSPDWLETTNRPFWFFYSQYSWARFKDCSFLVGLPYRFFSVTSIVFSEHLSHLRHLLSFQKERPALGCHFQSRQNTLEWKLLRKGSLQRMIKLPYLGETLEKWVRTSLSVMP